MFSIAFSRGLTLDWVFLHEAVTSKMLHVVTPSLSVVSSQPSTSKGADTSAEKSDTALLDFEDELRMRSRTLSSTLHKLYLWEKKLFNEVKVCCYLYPVARILNVTFTFELFWCSNL